VQLTPATNSALGGSSGNWATSVVWGKNVIVGNSVLWGSSVVWGKSTAAGSSVLWGKSVVWGASAGPDDGEAFMFGDE
jgi:hypothetical protein